MKRRIIIDCDPGHDDAIALIMAFACDSLEVAAVASVAGNQTIEKTTRNAARVLAFLKKAPPLAEGAAKPLLRQLVTASSVHGETGLDGPILPDSSIEKSSLAAHELCFQTLKEGKATIVAIGPLTNVALLLLSHPEIRGQIEQIVIMGGGLDHGNRTPAAEFNILVDPEAAKIVFESGLPIVLCPLDVTEKAFITREEREKIRGMGRAGRLAAELVDFYGRYHESIGLEGSPLHDPCTIAYLVHPELFATEDLNVQVVTETGAALGQTLADRRPMAQRLSPNAKVCLGIDRAGFISFLSECCNTYGE